MKKLFENIKKMKRIEKVEFMVASIMTIALLISLPVYAWFSTTNRIETMAKIKEPNNLDLRAGHFHSAINFELSNINIESMKKTNTPEYRVFSVSAGNYRLSYQLQLAHTTNIPFKYTIYEATEVSTATATTVEYSPIYETGNTVYYYEMGAEVYMEALNGDSAQYGRQLGDKTNVLYNLTYDATSDTPDTPEIYAVPVYLQSGKITPPDRETIRPDYYVLKIEWDDTNSNANFEKWNKAENNKETDIIYLSASRYTD